MCTDDESRNAKKASANIDRQLQTHKAEIENHIKLLILGAGETGKSTIIKQFRLIYGKGYEDIEKAKLRNSILLGICNCAKALVTAMDTLKIPYGFDPKKPIPPDFQCSVPASLESLDDQAGGDPILKNSVANLEDDKITPLVAQIAPKRDVVSKYAEYVYITQGPFPSEAVQQLVSYVRELDTIVGFRNYESIPEEAIEPLSMFWNDPGVQYCWFRHNEFQIVDTCPYFLSEVSRFACENYIPTDQDILNTRILTTSISETRFEYDGLTFRLFDVGGQRGERKKWVSLFDDVTAVIYVAALGSFDQVCAEDVIESINLFASVCNNPVFKRTPTILFMNKMDIFEEKIKSIEIKDYFPEYEADDGNFAKLMAQQAQGAAGTGSIKSSKEAKDFFVAKFLKASKFRSKKTYVYFTCATNTKQIKAVLETVRQIIIENCLKDIGLT